MLPPEKGFNQNKVVIDVEVGQNGGRFPANLLISDDILNDGKERISKYGKSTKPLKDSIFLGDNYGQDRCDACNEFIGDSGSKRYLLSPLKVSRLCPPTKIFKLDIPAR